jgi:endonuclease YncB( thermonuclease family)
MFVFEDLTGQRFWRLVAVCYVGADGSRVSLWRFKCDCGETVIARGSAVKHGRTKSCGCLRKETAASQIRKLGRWGTENSNYRHGRRASRAAGAGSLL